MADLRDDILKEEEQYGGFNPGEPDDDSFSIQDKIYPGNIFLFLNPLKPSAEPEIIEDISEDSEIGEFQPDEDFSEPLIEEEEELFEFEKKKLQKKEIDKPEELDDPNFIGYIQGLASVSRKKSKSSDIDNHEEHEIRPFEPIDIDTAETSVIITDLDLDRPSTSVVEDMNHSPQGDPPPATINDINPDISNREEENPDKPEKKKRGFIIPIIGVAAALFLIVSGALLYFLPEKPFGLFSSSDEQKADSLIKSSELKGKRLQDSLIAKQNNDKSEDNLVEDTTSKLVDTLVLSESKDSAQSQAIKPEIKDIDKEIAKVAEKIATKPKEEIASKVSTKKPVIEAKKVLQNNTTQTEVSRKTPAPKAKKPVTPIEVNPDKNFQEELIRERAIDETFVPKDEPGIYIVQIYSSRSKEDASAWLNKLISKSVPDAFISEQTIRDKTWYRVRFGKYSTREEAKNAALRYGYAQTWIDRVK